MKNTKANSVIERLIDYQGLHLQWTQIAAPEQPHAPDTTEKRPQQALFVAPTAFRIADTINVHMRGEDGQPRKIDKQLADSQWHKLVEAYRPLVEKVHVLTLDADLPDIVFCANQTMPFLGPKGARTVLLSEMRSPSRKPEVSYFRSFFESQGYACIQQTMSPPLSLEGMGDVMPLQTWRDRPTVLCAGYGHRTDRKALDWVATQTGLTVCAFELPNPKFYHLDTCLSILTPNCALACRQGFTDQGWKLLQAIFGTVIEAPLEESDYPGFACNCHCPDGTNVLIQRGNRVTNQALQQAGFQVIEVDTSEFIKAGGSVFCMKMMFY
jgi:N-dimethylarginine dimethylaminohydrolase